MTERFPNVVTVERLHVTPDGVAAKKLAQYCISAESLFSVAKDACDRIRRLEPNTSGGKSDAMVSLLFSAATLEALAMEMQLFASLTGRGKQSKMPQFVREVADALEKAECAHKSIEDKFLLLRSLLPEKPYTKGAQPFQDFKLLVRIRNAIVHMKPQEFTTEPHELIRALADKRLCLKGAEMSWVGTISTPAVARWACNVVSRMVYAIEASLARADAHTIYAFGLVGAQRRFSPVE